MQAVAKEYAKDIQGFLKVLNRNRQRLVEKVTVNKWQDGICVLTGLYGGGHRVTITKESLEKVLNY